MKTWSRISVIMMSFWMLSCDNSFDINAPHQNVYALNCILRGDRTTQYAFVSKNYFTQNGTAPAPNTIERNIHGVSVTINTSTSRFMMRDTTIQLTISGTTMLYNCYYVKNLPLQPGTEISIEATTPDGHVLMSSIHIPRISFGKVSWNFPQLNFITYDYVVNPFYFWNWPDISGTNDRILNVAQLEVKYQKYENGGWADKETVISLSARDIKDIDRYVSLPDSVPSLYILYTTSIDDVNKVMREISAGDPNKSHYKINSVVLNVKNLSPILTKYYFAAETFSEDFTIKLRNPNITNIEGGEGLFGGEFQYTHSLDIDRLYVESFGYMYDPL